MESHRASLSTQIFYGSGSISVGIKNNLLGTYLLIYYNQVLGLDAGIAALAMAIALAVDAVSDPLVGIWSDRIRTRWGRRHPFMYAALLPFAGSYYLLLADPGDISDQSLFARLLVLLIILRLSMTFYEVPRGALAPELSKDYYQRNALSAWSMAFGWLGGAGIAFVANFYFLDSFVDKEGYQTLAFGVAWHIHWRDGLVSWDSSKHSQSLRARATLDALSGFLREARETWPIDHGSFCS